MLEFTAQTDTYSSDTCSYALYALIGSLDDSMGVMVFLQSLILASSSESLRSCGIEKQGDSKLRDTRRGEQQNRNAVIKSIRKNKGGVRLISSSGNVSGTGSPRDDERRNDKDANHDDIRSDVDKVATGDVPADSDAQQHEKVRFMTMDDEKGVNSHNQDTETNEAAGSKHDVGSLQQTSAFKRDAISGYVRYSEDKGSKKGHKDETEGTKGKTHRFPLAAKVLVGVILALVVIATAAYGIGFAYYGDHLMPHTYVDDMDVSNMTASDASGMGRTSRWYVTITDAGETMTIDSKDIDFQAKEIPFDEIIASQDRLSWPLYAVGSKQEHIEREISYDRDKLDALVSELNCVSGDGRTESQDATAEYDEESGRYVVKKEVIGDKVDKDKLLDEIEARIVDFEPVAIDISELDVYCDPPNVTSDDETLNEQVDKLNHCLDTVIHYTIDGVEDAETVDASLIHEWVSLDENEEIALDEDAMRKWLSEIGKKYDTVGTMRTFTRSDGSRTYEVSGGDYGWITDEATELGKLKGYVLSGDEQSVEFSTKQSARGAKGDELGDTYLEIDLGRQRVYYVKDGNLVFQTNCITGNPNNGNSTPTGVYDLNAKQNNQILRGPKDPSTGEYKWESEVKNWMPFIGNSVGCHDADWQSWGAWTASRYLSVGSHGCVNLSPSAANELFNLINVGDPVVVHN